MTIPQGWVPTAQGVGLCISPKELASKGSFYFAASPFTFTDDQGHWTRHRERPMALYIAAI